MKRSDKVHMSVLFVLIIVLGLMTLKVDVLGLLTAFVALSKWVA